MSTGQLGGLPWLRIIAEGTMIVTSILLALAVDAAWGRRQDHALEESYLRMLATDLRETLSNNARFSDSASSYDWAGARLVQAYYEPRLPPIDSISHWARLSFASWQVEPTLGTAETLTSTGDLRVIRKDSLRAAITQYVTYMRTFDGFEQESLNQFRELRERLFERLGPDFIPLRGSPIESLSPSDDLYPYPANAVQRQARDIPRLVGDGANHLLLWRMNEAKGRMRINRERMRAVSQRLLEQVEAVQSRW